MDQNKVGKFIQKLRKEKKMTQQELADKLGVTDKSIGNWENGRNMPDLSLFKPLCDILDISINELMSGERIDKDKYQEKFEENIVNTINYSTNQIDKYTNVMGHLLIIMGLFTSMSAIMIFSSESIWGSIYSVFGIVLFLIGMSRLTTKTPFKKRMFLLAFAFIFSFGVLILTDYISVRINNVAPMFRKTDTNIKAENIDITYYNNPFYKVVKCDDKYHIIKNKKYTNDELIEYCQNKK